MTKEPLDSLFRAEALDHFKTTDGGQWGDAIVGAPGRNRLTFGLLLCGFLVLSYIFARHPVEKYFTSWGVITDCSGGRLRAVAPLPVSRKRSVWIGQVVSLVDTERLPGRADDLRVTNTVETISGKGQALSLLVTIEEAIDVGPGSQLFFIELEASVAECEAGTEVEGSVVRLHLHAGEVALLCSVFPSLESLFPRMCSNES